MSENTAVILLQKDKFDLYSPLIGSVIEFRFVPEIVRDLDVVNPELFGNLIKLFVANNKITPSELVIVIADNACFVKDFAQPAPAAPTENQLLGGPKEDEFEKQISEFIEHVPFDDVASKRFPTSNGVKVWTTNKTLFTIIIDSLSMLGFTTKTVLPSMVFNDSLNSGSALDPGIASLILQSLDSLRQYNLLSGKDIQIQVREDKSPEVIKKTDNSGEEIEIEETPSGKKSNKRLFIMLGVFAILIIILIFVYLGSLSQTP